MGPLPRKCTKQVESPKLAPAALKNKPSLGYIKRRLCCIRPYFGFTAPLNGEQPPDHPQTPLSRFDLSRRPPPPPSEGIAPTSPPIEVSQWSRKNRIVARRGANQELITYRHKAVVPTLRLDMLIGAGQHLPAKSVLSCVAHDLLLLPTHRGNLINGLLINTDLNID